MDAAYAGSAFICPEFQYLMYGIEVIEFCNNLDSFQTIETCPKVRLIIQYESKQMDVGQFRLLSSMVSPNTPNIELSDI